MKQTDPEFIEICEIFKSMTHTRRMDPAAKYALWEGCLRVMNYPVQLWKENWKNRTKNISMSLHEVKWEEEKITNFTLLKICTNNWKTECTKESGFLSCSREYLRKFVKKIMFEIEKYVSNKTSDLETINCSSIYPMQIWKYRCMNRCIN
jgi:hypothetical protein